MKKILCLFFVIVFLFSSIPVSYASDEDISLQSSVYEDGQVARKVIFYGLDEETNTYGIFYRIFNEGGLCERTVHIPADLYNKEHWFLFYASSVKKLVFGYIDTTVDFPVMNMYRPNAIRFELVSDSGTCYVSEYSFETDTFGDFRRLTSRGYDEKVNANDFIYCKNVVIQMVSKANVPYTSSFFTDYQTFKCPEMKYMTDKGVRLYVNDFHGSTDITSTYEVINALQSLDFAVLDLNNNNNTLTALNLLTYSDLQQDEDGRYYIDLLFEDLLPYFNTINADLVLTLVTNLKSTKVVYAMDDTLRVWDMVTYFQSADYWRYQYYADSGAGLLVPSDAEGNPTNPDGGDEPTPPEKNETADAINNQTQKIEEQTNAINNQTQKIEEQTDAIKENTETNKNIFQQIIELPRQVDRFIT